MPKCSGSLSPPVCLSEGRIEFGFPFRNQKVWLVEDKRSVMQPC